MEKKNETIEEYQVVLIREKLYLLNNLNAEEIIECNFNSNAEIKQRVNESLCVCVCALLYCIVFYSF